MRRQKNRIRARAENMDGRENHVAREIRLHLNALTRGSLGYEMADVHLRRAINFGLRPGETFRIGDEKFQLVDNTDENEPFVKKGVAWRPARFARYEIREVKDDPVAAVKPATES